MKNKDLGSKMTCTECGIKFYDLNKSPASCPKCHLTVENIKKIKNKKNEAEEPITKQKNQATEKKEFEDNIDPIENLENDVDDGILEDTNDIENMDDDKEALGSVIVNINDDKDNNP